MRIGYARVSTSEQNLDLQKDALKRAGCEKIIEDVVSGKTESRSGLDRARDLLREGDVLVVWRLDRLGRSLKHLIELMSELEKQKIEFQSLQESIDTTTPGGKLIFHMFGALAEFERNLISDRTKAGLEAARARGRRGGRPKKLNAQQRELANDLYNQKKHGIDEICRSLGISKPTLYAYISSRGKTQQRRLKEQSMGWNDHMDDNELGNLPPEAFSTWNVDGPFEPQDHWLETAGKDDQIIAMRAWFLGRYCDPAHSTPYNGREGGYQFIHGGPYDPEDVLHTRFARVVKEDVIQEVVDELHQEVGDEWAPVQHSFDDDYDDDYGVDIEDSGQPLFRLRDRLTQSKQVLTLQGNFPAQLLARNLAFGSVITSLESFLWETVTYWVDHDEATVINIVTKIQVFRDQPLKLGQIFEKRETLKNEIKAYLQNLVWHQRNKVAPLFTHGLGIDSPGFKQFEGALIKRHDIVHRSGYSKTGERVNVDVAEIEALCEQILRFAEEINEKLANRKSAI